MMPSAAFIHDAACARQRLYVMRYAILRRCCLALRSMRDAVIDVASRVDIILIRAMRVTRYY